MISLLRNAFKNFKFRSLLLRTLLSLIAIVVLPSLLIGFFGNWHSQETINKEVNQSSLQMLEQTRRLMDGMLNDIDEMAIQLSQIEPISEIMYQDHLDGMDNEISQVHDYLTDFYISQPFINSIYVYYKKSNMIQIPLLGIKPLDSFEDTGWLPFLEQMQKKEGQWIVRNIDGIGNEAEYTMSQVTLIRPIPLVGKESSGAIIVNMNQEALFQSPSLRLMREGEEIWMVSPDGQHAYDSKRGFEIDFSEFALIKNHLTDDITTLVKKFREDEYAFTGVTSPYTGWKYVNVIPTESLHKSSNSNQAFMMLLAALCISIAVIVVLFLVKRIYYPIHTLIEMVKNTKDEIKPIKKNEKTSEFSFLFTAMQSLKNKRTELEEQIQENLPTLQQSFLNQLLLGQLSDYEEYDSKFEYYNLDFYSTQFFVCVLRIDDYTTFLTKYSNHHQSLLRYFISKLAEEVTEQHYHVIPFNTEGKDVILICNVRDEISKESFHEVIVQSMRKINEYIQQYLDMTISIGIGDLHERAGNIPHSYDEALESLELRAFMGYEVVVGRWFKRNGKSPDKSALEKIKGFQRYILIAVKSMDRQRVAMSLQEYQMYCKTLEGYPFSLIQHGLSEMVIGIIQNTLELGMDPKQELEISYVHNLLMKQETVEMLFNQAEDLIYLVIDNLSALLIDQKTDVSQQIIEYIQANFNRDISLGGIADQLNLAPSYVSRLFKQEVSINFMDYLISLRITRAKQLLQEENITVKDISGLVGYTSHHSFIRIFKKYEGVTPGQFRDKHHPKKLDMDKLY